MKKVAEKHHLLERGGAWYYRRRVPKSAQSVIGKKVLQFSLGSSKKAAIRERERLDVEWSKKFDEAEAAERPSTELSVNSPAAQKRVLTEAEAIQRARAYVEKEDERRRKDSGQGSSVPPRSAG